MRIFLAGATGVIGQRFAVLLGDMNHEVSGTTRNPAKVPMLHALDIAPVVVDVFDADALAEAVAMARPDVIIHQLTDLSSAPGTPGYPAVQEPIAASVSRAREIWCRLQSGPECIASSPKASPLFIRRANVLPRKMIRLTSQPKEYAN